jgi:hypothetical protein
MASDFQLLLSPTPSNGCNCVPVLVEDWKEPNEELEEKKLEEGKDNKKTLG